MSARRVRLTHSNPPAAEPRATARPPVDPAAARAPLAGYSGTPLPKKLGIKPGFVVAMIGAPRSFRRTLGGLPDGASLRERSRGAADLFIWFNRSRRDLEWGIEGMAARIGRASVWIIWPKKASGQVTDLSERCVRETGLAAGLVDYKVCAVDATWSGLLFTRRRAPARVAPEPRGRRATAPSTRGET